MPLVFSLVRVLRPGSSLSRPSAFAYRGLSQPVLAADILSFLYIAPFPVPFFIFARSVTSHTPKPSENRQRIAISLSRLVHLPFPGKQRGLHGPLRPRFHLIFSPATFQFALFYYFYLSA